MAWYVAEIQVKHLPALVLDLKAMEGVEETYVPRAKGEPHRRYLYLRVEENLVNWPKVKHVHGLVTLLGDPTAVPDDIVATMRTSDLAMRPTKR
jgi:hypothetical protein